MFSIEIFHVDIAVFLVGFFCTSGILFYYFYVWTRYGGKNPKRNVIPLFEPPEDISPAAAKYLLHQCYDNKAFTAAIISMAIKGALKIKAVNNVFTLERNPPDNKSPLTEEEKIIAIRLFGVADSIEITTANHLAISLAIDEVKKTLDANYKTCLVDQRLDYVVIGGILSFLTLLAMAIILNNQDYEKIVPMVMMFVFSAVGLGIFYGLKIWYADAFLYRKEGCKVAKERSDIGIWVLGISIVLNLIILLVSSTLLYGFIVYALLAINLLFYHLFETPTDEGRKLLDQIDGFGLYLMRTGKASSDSFNPPEHTIETFERFLPWAVALDIEDYWEAEFSDIFGKLGYDPSWFSGVFVDPEGHPGLASSIVYVFTKAVTGASVDPNARR